MRPLLYLDVDGTLLPFGAAGPYPVHEPDHGTPYGDGRVDPDAHPLLTRIDPGLGPRLRALDCVLVWATTWLDDANEVIAPWLGLPPLPVLDWPDEDEAPGATGGYRVSGGRGVHWKTRHLVAHAAGRPFVWLDDEITAADHAWVGAHHPGRALLHRVDHRRALTGADFDAVRGWLRAA
ncbi:HAD domain-containing protein [Streptomyces sp. NPDC091377]|uniref:HAD domain-containing protein n=1 Tax=Streptomyces sp. NPDC091377 TaxID=3365995 RepID=UPI00380433DB